MNRRRFLKYLGAGALAACGSGGYFYLNNEDMQPAPVREGKVLCDLHAHLPPDAPLEELVQFLGSPGLIGLTQRYEAREILTYEMARDLLGEQREFEEITAGKLARFRKGYLARTQEVKGGVHHFLAVGWEGDYLEDRERPQEAVQSIHDHGGIVIFNHPYTVPGGFGFRIANEQEQETLQELLFDVDEIEVHNATNIDYFFIDMRKANRLALQLAEASGKLKGTASSDAHGSLDQAKICGIYVDKRLIESNGIQGLREAITRGNFERYGDP